MKLGDEVRWLGANPDGWSGDGHATVKGYDAARPYFHGGAPATEKGPRTGPAVLLQLHNEWNHLVWASPDDIMPWLGAP